MLQINQSLGIDQCNCFAIRKAARQISRFYDAHLEPSGLRITQFLTLAALNELGGTAVSALAERLDIDGRRWGKWWTFCSATAWSRSSRRPLTVEAASSNSPRREAAFTKKRPRSGRKHNKNSTD